MKARRNPYSQLAELAFAPALGLDAFHDIDAVNAKIRMEKSAGLLTSAKIIAEHSDYSVHDVLTYGLNQLAQTIEELDPSEKQLRELLSQDNDLFAWVTFCLIQEIVYLEGNDRGVLSFLLHPGNMGSTLNEIAARDELGSSRNEKARQVANLMYSGRRMAWPFLSKYLKPSEIVREACIAIRRAADFLAQDPKKRPYRA